MGYKVESLRIGPEKNFCYLIHTGQPSGADTKTSFEGVLIDAAFDFDKVTRWVDSFSSPEKKLEIKYLLATHGHLDHAGGLNEMKARFPGAKIAAQENEKARLTQAGITVDVLLKDKQELSLNGLKIQVWHTPGHTEGGCCYLVGNEVITGDTLFVGQCGRTDMPGGSDELLFGSLQRLKDLPERTIVRPGHDYGPQPQSTIGREMQTNATMKVKTLAEFIALP